MFRIQNFSILDSDREVDFMMLGPSGHYVQCAVCSLYAELVLDYSWVYNISMFENALSCYSKLIVGACYTSFVLSVSKLIGFGN